MVLFVALMGLSVLQWLAFRRSQGLPPGLCGSPGSSERHNEVYQGSEEGDTSCLMESGEWYRYQIE